MARERLEIDLHKGLHRDEEEQVHIARYDFASQYVAGKKVLDIACGVGYGSCLLVSCFSWNATS
jgi:2-polyprenyl-3-methyl-5-hydroxy-6-metoxy-1,4-benzoquinol methylase